jgi:hypothetical protein
MPNLGERVRTPSSLGAGARGARGAPLEARFGCAWRLHVCRRTCRLVPPSVGGVCSHALVRAAVTGRAARFGCAVRGGHGGRRRTSGRSSRRHVCRIAPTSIDRSNACGRPPPALGAGSEPRQDCVQGVPFGLDTSVDIGRRLAEETHGVAHSGVSCVDPEQPGHVNVAVARLARSKGRDLGCGVGPAQWPLCTQSGHSRQTSRASEAAFPPSQPHLGAGARRPHPPRPAGRPASTPTR